MHMKAIQATELYSKIHFVIQPFLRFEHSAPRATEQNLDGPIALMHDTISNLDDRCIIERVPPVSYASLRRRLILVLDSLSPHLNRHKQLSSSLSRRRSAAKLELNGIKIFKSPG